MNRVMLSLENEEITELKNHYMQLIDEVQTKLQPLLGDESTADDQRDLTGKILKYWNIIQQINLSEVLYKVQPQPIPLPEKTGVLTVSGQANTQLWLHNDGSLSPLYSSVDPVEMTVTARQPVANNVQTITRLLVPSPVLDANGNMIVRPISGEKAWDLS